MAKQCLQRWSIRKTADLNWSDRTPSPTGYTSVDRTGSYFMSSHYQSGWVAVYRIEKNGIVGDATPL